MTDVAIERGRIASNTAAQLVAPALRAVIGVALAAILGRYLGVAGFGEYGVVVAVVLIFTNVLADWGLSAILLREVSRRPGERPRLIASATALQLALAAASYLLVAAIALASSYPDEVRWGLVVFGLTLLFAPVQMLSTHFLTDLRAVRLIAPAVAGTATQLVLVLLVVAAGAPLVAVLAAGVAGVAVEQIWTAAIVLREVPLGRPSLAPWRAFIAEAWPLGASMVVGTGARQAPILVLSTISLEATGLFSAAERIPNYLTRVPYAYRATMFPILSRAWGGAGFVRAVWAAILGTLALSLPVAVLGVALSDRLVALVFGGAFAAAAAAFAVLTAAFLFVALGIVLESVLVAMGAQRANLVIRVTSALVLVAPLPALAARDGAAGAATAVLAGAVGAFLLSLGVVWRRARG